MCIRVVLVRLLTVRAHVRLSQSIVVIAVNSIMSVVPKRVIGRNNQHWGDLKKDISITLGQLREFVTTVTQEKKSARGFKSTCDQILSFLAEAKKNTELVHRKVFGDDGVVESAAQIEYDMHTDKNGQRAMRKLSRASKSLSKYMAHFEEKVQEKSAADAAVSIDKYRDGLLRVIDRAKAYNIKCEKAVKAYLKSAAFITALQRDDSTVAIAEADLAGTRAEKRAFLAAVEAKELAAHAATHPNGEAGASDGDDDEQSSEEPVREENFIVEDDGEAHPIPEDDDDDAAALPNDSGAARPEETFEADDDDESDDDEVTEDSGEDDDSGASSDGGGALFESNLSKINRRIVKSVEKNADVRGGRLLRNNGRMRGYAEMVAQNADLQVDDDYRSAPSSKRQLTKKNKRKLTEEEEEAKEYGSELSGSSDDDDAAAAVENVSGKPAPRNAFVAPTQLDESQIQAQIRQIEDERRRAARSEAAAVAAATATGAPKATPAPVAPPKVKSSVATPAAAVAVKREPHANGHSHASTASNGVHSNGHAAKKAKPASAAPPPVAARPVAAVVKKEPMAAVKREPLVSDD